MDYDDNEFQGQNLQLAGEGFSKIFSASHPYALPKFEFDDSLQGHLRFDSLVENEFFLGITSQEDNQWIEEYSRGSSEIEFSSSAVESRRNNVWSEATSSESVEMLLKSVGQEEKVVTATIIERLDICDEPGSLTKIMDPNLNQDDAENHVTPQNVSLPDEVLGNLPTSSEYEQSQEVYVSSGGLDSVVLSKSCNFSVSEEKMDNTFDDVSNKEVDNLAEESMEKELPEDTSVSRVESIGASIEELKVQENVQQVSVNASGAAELSIQSTENSMDVAMDSGIMIVEGCTYSLENSVCDTPDVESAENPLSKISIPFNEEPTDLLPDMPIAQGGDAPISSAEASQGSKCAPAGSLICSDVDQDLKDHMHEVSVATSASTGSSELQAVHEGNTKTDDPVFPESDADSLSEISPIKNTSVDENEYAIGKDAHQITSDASPETGSDSRNDRLGTSLPDDVLAKEVPGEDVIAGNKASEVHIDDEDTSSMKVDCKSRSSESDVVRVDQDGSLTEKDDGNLPLASSDMDIEVVQALDNQKNVETSLSVEDSKENTVIAPNFESNVLNRVDQVAAMESVKSSSSGISEGSHQLSGPPTAETNDQPKSPIFGVSLVDQGNLEKVEVGSPYEDNPQNESSHVEGVVASDTKNPSSLVEKEASPDMVEKIDVHCTSVVEECNANHIEIEKEPENNTNTGGQECSNMLETSPPCESSEKSGNNSVAGDQLNPKESVIEVNKSNEHQASVDVARLSECVASDIGQDGGSFSNLGKPQAVSPMRVSTMELSQSAKDKQETTAADSPLPSKTTNDVEGNIQPVSISNGTQEENNLTFEVNTSAGKGSQSYPTFQASMVPRIMDGPSTDTSSSQVDARKLPVVSPSPQNASGMTSQIGVKGKSERKPRRKSVAKENARKDSHLKETTPVRVEKSSATGAVIQFEKVKSNENAERSGTKLGGVLPLPKLPDLNNSTFIYQQPFTDNQQVQLRAQILVYGSLISGSPPEEPHMIAAFGQSDDGRTWEGVWRACLERLHVQKAQAVNTPTQSQSVDEGVKHASVQNKATSSPSGAASNKGAPSPMIPLSSPLWNITTPSDSMKFGGMPSTARLQALSPLHPAVGQHSNNPSWLSQGPFAGQWVATPPIPAFNTGPRFPALPITPAKESKHTSTPKLLNAGPEASSLPSYQPSTDPKSRKRKKGSATVRNVKQISDPSLATPSAPAVGIHLPQGMVSLPAPNQTDLPAPVVTSPFSASNSSPVKFLFASPTHPRSGSQNTEKAIISEETLSKVEESKIQAVDAAERAAAAVSHCHGVWSQLERQNHSGLNSDDEAKLVSSAVSLAAAASVAKVAAAAAKIASDVAEQARSMVNVFLSNKRENLDQSNKFDKATPSSIVYKAREADWQRVEAASASWKHPENLDAIVKAAELAAEAVSQAGKIVAMSEPFPLRHLVEAGPEGYWKTPLSASKQQSIIAGNFKAAPQVSDKEIENSGDLAENQTMEVHENNKRKPRVRKGRGVAPKSEMGSVDTCIAEQPKPEVASETLKENNIKEGCLVEVYKDDGAWFGAHVLSLKDGKALVCYTDFQSDEGQLKEWVPLEVKSNEVPKIRVAHPFTLIRPEGTKKRSRTAVTDFVWSSGDRVDVWIQDRWREGVVMETNKIDPTSLKVKFSGHRETSIVGSWFVRPTLIWKDGKWVECHASSSQGDTPQEKRMKLASPVLESKQNEEKVVDLKEQEESRTLPLSTQESLFSVGSTGSGLQKGGPRVVFGVPKPGKKQKFMDVSKHYVGNASNKASTRHPHDSVKFTKYLIPQAPGGMRNNSVKEKQAAAAAAETKPRTLKPPRKPPVPSLRTLTFSKSTTKNKTTTSDSVSDDKKQSDQQNQTEFDAPRRADLAIPAEHVKKVSTSSTRSERVNKRKFVSAAGGKEAAKEEKSLPEHNAEPSRRSNRKIQPTSRLLEGLQSSMTISKIPAASHFAQRSHTKATPKGNTNNNP